MAQAPSRRRRRDSRDRRKRVILLLPHHEHTNHTADSGLRRQLIRAGFGSVRLHKFRWIVGAGYMLSKAGLIGNLAQHPRYAMFALVHRLSEANLFPSAYLFESIVYAYDCWPCRYPEWEAFFRRHRIRVAFLSAQQSAEEFRRRIPEMKTYWLPEACDPGDYLPDKPLADRPTDVLELGRRYADYHARIREPLRVAGSKHLFERVRGSRLFPQLSDLVQGYGNAKVSICFPASITDPHWAEGVETATFRYFESMASKCVIVGHAPAELVDLYGYNPVIEADMTDPVAQLQSILSDVGQYQSLVDRNFTRTLQVGTFESRASQVARTLVDDGYRL